MIIDEIRENLLRLQDTEYRDFQVKLIPSADPCTFIGVRTPELRELAKQLSARDDIDDFLNDLPHGSFEENQLHSFVISGIKDYPVCLDAVDRFLPFVDNWATCDQLSPQVFRKHRQELIVPVRNWISSDRTYTVRFAVGMLMEHYLDKDFFPECLDLAAAVRSEEYYIKMMVAWYFATALAKQYDAAIQFIENKSLDPWTHNKTIQKALESRRIGPGEKRYLRGLRI